MNAPDRPKRSSRSAQRGGFSVGGAMRLAWRTRVIPSLGEGNEGNVA